MVERSVRAGDGDRERVAEALRRHFAEGRLTPEEFDARLTECFAARTMGDLADLVVDLPHDPDGYALPVPVSSSGSAPVPRRRADVVRHDAWRPVLATYITTCLVCIVVWALSGHAYFWPGWVIGPWGAVLLGQAVTGRGARDR